MAQASLIGRQHVDSATAIVLTVERKVVLEHIHGEFRGRERSLFHQHCDGREGTGSGTRYCGRHWHAGDWSSTHAMAPDRVS